MASREKVTSAFAPDLDEVRAWLQKMIAVLRFVEMVTAVIGVIARMRDINTELVAQLAHLRRRHPRSEALDRIERQLVLPLGGLTVPNAAKPKDDTTSDDDKKKRRGRHPGRSAPPSHLQRVPVFNRVPAELRVCPQCGAMMTPVSHSSCLVLNVIPARVFVEERLDETIACPNDDTIVSASPLPQIVERGKLADTLIVEAVCDKYIEHLPIERQRGDECRRHHAAAHVTARQDEGRNVCREQGPPLKRIASDQDVLRENDPPPLAHVGEPYLVVRVLREQVVVHTDLLARASEPVCHDVSAERSIDEEGVRLRQPHGSGIRSGSRLRPAPAAAGSPLPSPSPSRRRDGVRRSPAWRSRSPRRPSSRTRAADR
jgi:hypothetical protein